MSTKTKTLDEVRLDEIIKLITPLPWSENMPHSKSIEQARANRAYENHAANVLPELVEAAKALSSATKWPTPSKNKMAIVEQLDAALARAQKVNV